MVISHLQLVVVGLQLVFLARLDYESMIRVEGDASRSDWRLRGNSQPAELRRKVELLLLSGLID
jgi:hypothetical protein